MNPVRIGVIGCGAISKAYLKHAQPFAILDIAACADLDHERAEQRAQEFGVPRACSVDQLLADHSIDLVLNLTVPQAHAPIALRAIEAGKHVYSEKPFAVTPKEGRRVLDAAAAKGVRVGNAPDTFFGAGHQTARRLVDQGVIGRPVAATAFMMSPGVENWHPNAKFFYEPGGGPLFDMGPYYITDLLQLLGPMTKVCGSTAIAIPQRVIPSPSGAGPGTTIEVHTPDHVTGSISFANGCIATLVMSFAVVHADLWPLTVFGTNGTLRVPDPNGFDGSVFLRLPDDEDWQEVPTDHRTGYGRAVGLADMAHAIRSGRPHRASGDLAFVVLEAMQGLLDSGHLGHSIELTAKSVRPTALPTNLPEGYLDS